MDTGHYIPRTHPHYEEVLVHATWVHAAHSEGWKDVLILVIGLLWDWWAACGEDPGGKLTTFWNSYFVAPWAIWSIGDHMHIPCLIPSNQCAEAFFHNCVRVLGGRNHMRGNTHRVMQQMLPSIMNHQDLGVPDDLCFEVGVINRETFRWARAIVYPQPVCDPYRIRGWMNVIFHNKYLIIGNEKDDRFLCAYVLRGGSHGHNAMTMALVRRYEEFNRGSDAIWWHYKDEKPTSRNIKELQEELLRTVSLMEVAPILLPLLHLHLVRKLPCNGVAAGGAQGYTAGEPGAFNDQVPGESAQAGLHLQGVAEDRNLPGDYCGEPQAEGDRHTVRADAHAEEAEEAIKQGACCD